MRSGIDHLPPTKQRELECVVEIIFDEFREAIEHATGRRKGARILKVILFGSYARDDWVDAPLSANQYKSDYDILVIVNRKELADRATYWAKAEERLIREFMIEKTLRTPVNVGGGDAMGRSAYVNDVRPWRQSGFKNEVAVSCPSFR